MKASNSSPISEKTWHVVEALAMACSVYRQKGYTSTSTVIAGDPTNEHRWTNKDHVMYQLVPELAEATYLSNFQITEADLEIADAIIKHFRRLSFGVLGDNLNDYMTRVFNVTQKELVSFADLGVLASVPQVYEREIQSKEIKNIAKETKQEYLGKEGDRLTLRIRYINTRFIPNLNCFAHDAITDTNHLVNFLNKIELGKTGTCHTIQARVKKQGVNYITKTIETQLNYVKVLDNILVWQ
jgi:hypothetical protein